MVKSVLGLLSVKVMVAVSPTLRVLALVATTTVGTVVSVVMLTVLLASAPSRLRLPAASLNLSEATLTLALTTVLAVGVKVAVNSLPEPVKLLRVPPVTVTSAAVKSVLSSLRVKVMTATSPALRTALSLLTTMVGGTRSRVSVFMLTRLLASAPSALKLPAVSLNLDEATLMTLVAVLLALGL